MQRQPERELREARFCSAAGGGALPASHVIHGRLDNLVGCDRLPGRPPSRAFLPAHSHREVFVWRRMAPIALEIRLW